MKGCAHEDETPGSRARRRRASRRAGTPDTGLANPLISAHRGAITNAPENTLQSYEYAFAFGVDRTTNGTGRIADLTYDEVPTLNAADYAPWKGGAYNGVQTSQPELIVAAAGIPAPSKLNATDDTSAWSTATSPAP